MAGDGLAELQSVLSSLPKAIEDAQKEAAKKIGYMGREEVNREAQHLWGPDQKFSGAKTSKKAKRKATASFKVLGDNVEIYPSGDPWYIFLKGRGRSNIAPRKKGRHALSTPFGVFRRVHGGHMAPRTAILDPPTHRIAEKAPDLTWKAIEGKLVGAGFHRG